MCDGLKSLEQTLVTDSLDDGEIARRLEEEDRLLVTVVHIDDEGEDQVWVRTLGDAGHWERCAEDGTIVDSIPAAAADIVCKVEVADVPMQDDPAVSNVESEGVPGGGGLPPAAAILPTPPFNA